jgi:ribosomal protein S18 acetylase RimI-like enzyme
MVWVEYVRLVMLRVSAGGQRVGLPIDIAPLDRTMLDTATRTLARAFVDDPLFEWVFPDPATRAQKLGVLNRIPLQYGLRYGLRVTQSDRGRRVAIWLRPGQSLTPVGMARSGMLAAPFRVGFASLGRFARANATMEPVHKQAMGGQPHWHLLIVAVEPDLQGQGRGVALVRDGLDRADQDGLSCYLDTSRAANVPFYEHLGFATVAQVALGKGGGPPGWGMCRDPQPAATG